MRFRSLAQKSSANARNLLVYTVWFTMQSAIACLAMPYGAILRNDVGPTQSVAPATNVPTILSLQAYCAYFLNKMKSGAR